MAFPSRDVISVYRSLRGGEGGEGESRGDGGRRGGAGRREEGCRCVEFHLQLSQRLVPLLAWINKWLWGGGGFVRGSA